jgi:hypothetical protein
MCSGVCYVAMEVWDLSCSTVVSSQPELFFVAIIVFTFDKEQIRIQSTSFQRICNQACCWASSIAEGYCG